MFRALCGMSQGSSGGVIKYSVTVFHVGERCLSWKY